MSVRSTLAILVPGITSIPRLRKAFWSSAEHSSSSMGRMRGSISISVTLVPKEA